MSDINLQGEVIYPACQECKRLRAQLDAALAFAELHGHVMGRIAIALFGERNNRTDEECVKQAIDVVCERNRLRQHLHDEHQRHIGTMDERDAFARQLAISRSLLMECAQNLSPPWQNPDHPLWSLKARINATFAGQQS